MTIFIPFFIVLLLVSLFCTARSYTGKACVNVAVIHRGGPHWGTPEMDNEFPTRAWGPPAVLTLLDHPSLAFYSMPRSFLQYLFPS